MPVPPEVADLESMELRVIWQYLARDHPVHYRRTLDQFGYPSLRDTSARDNDQMLYKLTKEEATLPFSGKDARNLKAVMTSCLTAAENVEYTNKFLKKSRNLPLSDTSSEDSVPDIEDDLDGNALGSSEGWGEVRNVRDGKLLMVDQLWLWITDHCEFLRSVALLTGPSSSGPSHAQVSGVGSAGTGCAGGFGLTRRTQQV